MTTAVKIVEFALTSRSLAVLLRNFVVVESNCRDIGRNGDTGEAIRDDCRDIGTARLVDTNREAYRATTLANVDSQGIATPGTGHRGRLGRQCAELVSLNLMRHLVLAASPVI